MLYLIKSLVVGGNGIGDGPVLFDLLQPQKKVVDNTVRKNKMAVLTIAGSVNDFVQKVHFKLPQKCESVNFLWEAGPRQMPYFWCRRDFLCLIKSFYFLIILPTR